MFLREKKTGKQNFNNFDGLVLLITVVGSYNYLEMLVILEFPDVTKTKQRQKTWNPKTPLEKTPNVYKWKNLRLSHIS